MANTHVAMPALGAVRLSVRSDTTDELTVRDALQHRRNNGSPGVGTSDQFGHRAHLHYHGRLRGNSLLERGCAHGGVSMYVGTETSLGTQALIMAWRLARRAGHWAYACALP